MLPGHAPPERAMHELSATEGILNVALDAARGAGAARVSAIDVVIGDLSSMVGESVQFYFDLLSRDTAAAGALLNVRRQPATALCADCGASYAVTPPLSPACDACGGPSIRVSGGREFHVESIEVDP
jgi:hydrogenase nickel incorporation protein HypA/HybF